MKNKMGKYLIALIIPLVITSCVKYEDGPDFSFLSRKNRISKKWQLDGFENPVTGVVIDTNLSKLVWGFEKTGEFWKSDNTTGTWQFITNTSILITFDSSNKLIDSTKTYEITRSTRKQLWMKEKYPADTAVFHFIPV